MMVTSSLGLALIFGALLIVVVLTFLAPVYIYMIKNRMDIIVSELKILNSAIAEMKNENIRTNALLKDFISGSEKK